MGIERRKDSKRVVVQAGAVPVRWTDSGRSLEVLLITNRAGRWIVPKGKIERDQTARQAAKIECREEAGVIGSIMPGELGHYEYTKDGDVHRVRLFALRVHRELRVWDEQDRRQRRWMRLEKAASRVGIAALSDVLQKIGGLKRKSA